MADSHSVLPAEADTPYHARRAQKILLLVALAVPIAPNVIYFLSVLPHGFWLGQVITSLLLLAAPLLIGTRPRTALLIAAPFAILTPFLAAYAWVTGYAPSLLALQILREATREELINFIPAIALCTATGLGLGLGCWVLARSWGRNVWSIRPWVRITGLAALVLILGKDVIRQGPREGRGILLSRLEKMAPISPVALALHLEFSGPTIPDRHDILRLHTVTVDPVTPADAVCVLVIGESARKRAFGLYNPRLDTTPLLAKRPLVIFTDAASCGTATIQAVPILMTGRFPSHGEILPFRELGLAEAFRLAGFQTHWFSTQEADGEISSFISAFSVNAQDKEFVNGRLERSAQRDPSLKDDSALLPLLTAAVSRPGRQFIVLHTLGSHLPYVRRYPLSFEKWPVSAEDREVMWRWLPPYNQAQRSALDHAYLNSVYYTDWILDQVISILQASGRSSSMIYLSDHGENDASAPVMPANHGILTPDVTNIPFFMWFSESYRHQRPVALAALQTNAARPVSAQDLFSTVCALNGLHTSVADPTRSLASPDYREHPRFAFTLDGRTVPLPP